MVVRLPRAALPFVRANGARHRLYATSSLPQNRIEKIVQKYAVGIDANTKVRSGDYLMIRPDHVMTHDNTGPVISKFLSLDCSTLHNPRQPIFALDHDVQNHSDTNLKKYKRIEAFAKEHGVEFYPAGRGIGHQIMVEEGYALPGRLVVASDSHSNHYGGVGCLGTAIVRTDAAGIWATGNFWWQIPPVVSVRLEGRLRAGVTGKDVIVALAGLFNRDEVLNTAIEFNGSGIEHLAIDERLTIANMTTEWGAVAGVFPTDARLQKWYEELMAKHEARAARIPRDMEVPGINHDLNLSQIRAAIDSTPSADPGALYSSTLSLDLSSLVPYVSGPNSVKVATPLPDLAKSRIPINKAYLVSCTNSRASDIAAAASVVRGKTLAPGVEFYIAAASSVVQAEAEQNGDWQALVAAGAKTLPAGCGPCIGLGTGLLEKGETGISATNRNYKGRMGHPEAQAYLASPAVVAASAINGYISGPAGSAPEITMSTKAQFSIESTPANSSRAASSSSASRPLAGFPERFHGQLVFVPQDNLTTDGMYPGKYTYQDDITPERQAQVVMENYDPAFANIASELRVDSDPDSAGTKAGTILVGGYNFGTGSSREQAATAIKYAGIPLVVAGSFGDIFKRNSINNGLILVECPDFVADLTKRFAKSGSRGSGGLNGELTVVPKKWTLRVDVCQGELTVEMGDEGSKTYPCAKVGTSVQQIWVNGGLEGYIRASL